MSGALQITEQWRVLRRDMGNLISQLDGSFAKLEAEEKRMEQKRDESYQQGAEDMRKAVDMLYNSSTIGLSSRKMEELFGTVYIHSILVRHSAIEIINGLKKFLEEKEQEKETEFKVGDEVGLTNPRIGNNEKYIIIKTEPDSNTLWLINPKTFMIKWMDKDDANYKKTGRHFDTIDIPEGGATI